MKLQLDPLTIGLKDFVIHEKNAENFIAFDELLIKINVVQSIQDAALIIDELSLQKPVVHLARQADGNFNFQDLLKNQNDAETNHQGKFSVNVVKLSLSDGKLVWNDGKNTPAWSETLESLQLGLENFSTRNNKPANAQLDFKLQSGGHISWTGTIGLNPLASQGHLKLEHLNLSKFIKTFAPNSGLANISADNALDADYQIRYVNGKPSLSIPKASVDLHDIEYTQSGQTIKLANFKHETALGFDSADQNWQLDAKTAKIQIDDLRLQDKLQGKLNKLAIEAPYRISYDNKHLDIAIHEGSLEGKELRVSDQEKNLAFFPALALHGVQVNLDKHILKASSASLDNANLNVWLNADGTSNYQSLMPVAGAPMPVPASPSVENWQINIENIALNQCAINFEDRSLPKPTTLVLKPVNLKLNAFSNQPATRWPFELTAGVNGNGLIALKGSTSLTPFAAKANVEVKNIELEKFQPYYDKFIRLDLIDGMLNIDGELSLQQQPAEPLDVQFSGNSRVNDLLIRDQRVHKDFLKWEDLTLKNLAVDVLNQRYTAAELIINKPYARVTIRKDKTVNFSNLLITGNNQAKTDNPRKKTAAKQPYFKLGKIKIIDGSSDFTDLSLILPFSAYIKSLDGGASGVSSDKNSQIQVDLKGNAYDLAPVDIIGKITPYLGEYQTKINFNGLPMPLVSSYMVQFAGYKVEKGKMTLNLDYQIADKKLTASNHFLIDQFELGERVQHPDAVSLPIKLAVALLKDSNGKIKIDVPISGNLDNPKFNIGAIIADALLNSLSKIISSPFTVLASLIGHEDASLNTVHFKAGSATLASSQQVKLHEIAAALQNRPKLMLEIRGATLETLDWPAISDDALYDQLKIRRAAEINQHTSRKIRAEYVELSNEEYQRLLADMFIEKFPLLAEKSFLGVPQLKNPKTGQQFYEVAKQKLQDIIKPEQERLKELANNRAQTIAKYFVQQGKIAQERVYILDSVVNADKNSKEIVSLLSLKVN
ncbi:MAG: DUF748 domain-containing protein [Methylovulum sp.]|uniref:DUF748 domain-containing protein n=1 Tax=Methylovulum sp. TaxID=1916980 RepID=UPI00262B35C0|nr:DUF748 domain-containing protein [Methylovulum sp.]MDD2723092.1 DUF748 domain-containing protein [Methylovulum sp.]MDD5123558.1 DUF748 domain-containing protein [Methylovulum sp.]